MNRYNDTGVRCGVCGRSASLSAEAYRRRAAAPAADVRGTVRADAEPQGSCGSYGCGYGVDSRYGLRDMPVGMTYAPLQNYCDMYEPAEALARGTVFASLDMPLLTAPGVKGGTYRG